MLTKDSKKNNILVYEKKYIKWYYYLPLFLIICFVPLLLKARVVFLSEEQIKFWIGTSENIDFFSYAKMQWLLILSFIYFSFFSFLYVDKKRTIIKEPIYYALLLTYAIFIIISTIFASNKETALWGFVDMHQGIWVLLSYLLLTFLTINYVSTDRDIIVILKAFLILVIIEGAIGVGQYLGFDIFKASFIKPFLLSRQIISSEFNFTFGKYTIYGTLFNTNFVGSFSTIVLPIMIALYLIVKGRISKIISAIGIFFSTCLLIGCNSRAGYLGIIFVAILSIVFLYNQIKKNYKFFICLVILFIVMLVSFNIISKGIVFNQFSRLNLATEISNLNDNNNLINTVKFKEISLKEKEFTIKTNYEELTISLNNDLLTAYDSKNNIIDIEQKEDGKFQFLDNRYSNYSFTISMSEGLIIILDAYDRKIPLAYTDNGFKLISTGGRLADPIIAESFKPLDNYGKFASGRGYIWSRNLAMLSKTILYGYGPDNYVFNFPQDDFIAKLNSGYNTSDLVDKPHNMYFQIALNTGIISLIAFICMSALYIFDCIKIYYKTNYDNVYKCVGYASFMSVCGYLVAGIFNDQIISVAPLFWIVFGLGISINHHLKVSNKKVKE